MISFLGVRTDGQTDGQTDRVLESSILIWKHVGTQKNFNSKLKISGYWLAVDPYMPPWKTGMHKNGRNALVIIEKKKIKYN